MVNQYPRQFKLPTCYQFESTQLNSTGGALFELTESLRQATKFI